MRAIEPGQVQSAINVTPLVDVVLVLLIIFMVVAPQMQAGPALTLPVTDRPPARTEEGRRIVVALERSGAIWIDADAVSAERFAEGMRHAAAARGDRQVLIKGDAHLTFGQVKSALLAVNAAGFKDVGLIAERREDAGEP